MLYKDKVIDINKEYKNDLFKYGKIENESKNK